MAGLLRIINNAELLAAEREKIEAEIALRRQQETLESSLSAHIRRIWEQNKTAKRPIERTLLRCLRMRNGEYSSKELAQIRQIGGSEIYMMLTAAKCRAAKSWIADVYLNGIDKPWSLEHSPIPDLPDDIVQLIRAKIWEEVQTAWQQNQQPTKKMFKTVNRNYMNGSKKL